MMTTEQKTACITGGTSGIGKALALHLLANDWKVFAVGRNAKHAEQMQNETTGDEASRLYISHGDLRDYSLCEQISTRISETTDHLDLLVNGAGTIGAGGVLEESPERWDLVVSSNLTPAFNMTKVCVKLLADAGGGANIINISSVCSLRPCGSVAYSVSKAGMDMFTRSTAKELASHGIRVNSVNPSVVRSNLQKSAGLFNDDAGYENWTAQMKSTHPLGRIGEPDDIVAAIMYLISPAAASWVTGAVLSVDGGRGIA